MAFQNSTPVPQDAPRLTTNALPCLRPSSLHPPIEARLDAHLITFPMLFCQVIAFFRQRDIDDALPPLVLVKNDLLVVGSPVGLARKYMGDLHDFVPANNAILNRPVNIALLRV